MNYLPKVTRNTLTLFINRGVISVVNFIVAIYVIRYLGATRFGEYSLTFAFLAFFSLFTISSGIDQILVREVSRRGEAEDHRRKIATAIFLRLLLGGLGLLVAIGSSQILYADSPVAFYIFLSSFSLLFSFHENNSPFIVRYNTRLELLVPQLWMTGISLASALLKLLFVFGVKANLLAFILLDAALPVAISFAYWVLYRKDPGSRFFRGNVSWQEAKYLVKESVPLFFSTFFIVVYMRIDQILIAKWVGTEALGNYGVAVRIAEIFNFIPAYLAVSLLPVFTKTLSDDNRGELYEVCFRFLNLFIFPVILFFTLFPYEFLEILFPRQFPEAAGALRILIWSEFFVFAGVIHAMIILANGLQRYDILFVAIQAAANIALNWLLINRLSIEGASWSSVISYGIGLVVALLIPAVGRYTKILIRSSTVFLAISLAVTAVALAYPETPKIPLGIGGVLALLVFGIRKQDLRLMKDIFREITSMGRK
jgi:O-antigen/teichoic acid export membrane protein